MIDKVKLAQQKADEVKDIMRDNVKQLSENVKLLDEETVPNALEIARVAYDVQEQAEDVKNEELKRSRRLTCIIVLIVLALLAAIGLVFVILFM